MNPQTPQKPDFDLHALDALLDSFAHSARSRLTERSDFYAGICRQVAAATGSKAAALLVRNSKDQIRIVSQHHWKELGPECGPEAQQALQRILLGQPDASGTSSGKISSGSEQAAGTNLFFATCQPQSGMVFLFALIREANDSELAGELFRDLTEELVRQVEVFENTKIASGTSNSALELTHLAQMMQNLGKSRDQKEMSFQLVNDLAKLTRVDRVTCCSPQGKIIAVSGVSDVSRRTSVANSLTRIAQHVALSGESVEWSDGTLSVESQSKSRGLGSWVAELTTGSGLATRISSQDRSCGVLIFERFEPVSDDPMEHRELINQAVDFVAPVVQRKTRTYAIPGIRWLDFLFNRLVTQPVRIGLAAVIIACLVFLAAYGLFFVERTFEIRGDGILQTVERQHVFAQVDGEVQRLLVTEGDTVASNQLLLTVRSKDLEKDIVTAQGEIQETQTELRNLDLSGFREDPDTDEARVEADIQRLNVRLETQKARLAFFLEKQKQLNVAAPIAGQVTTQNLRQRLLRRPVNRGDLLMTICQTKGEWELALEIPDSQVEFIKAAQANSGEGLNVQFRLATDSETTYQGTLDRIDYRAEQAADGELPKVVAYVRFDEQALGQALRLGARVNGKVDCGQRHHFYLLTYELRNRINQWLF